MILQAAAAILLVIGYVLLLRGIITGEDKTVNGYSFIIWGSLSLCTNVLARDPTMDPAIARFTMIMCFFQYAIAATSIWKRQYAKISRFEAGAVTIAAFAMILWYTFREEMGFYPLALIILADVCALCPSVIDLAKAKEIQNDFISGFVLFGIVATLIVLGLENKNPQSLAYPVFEVCVNFGIAFYALYRKKTLQFKPA